MLKLRKMMQARGFTLVELLIVIAIIGILAVAVLAALDPIEQLKKSRDTGRLADARELYSAYNRYYASYGCYPEEMSGTQCGTSVSWALRPVTNTSSVAGISGLVVNGELKAQFTGKQPTQRGQLWNGQALDDSMSICFTPESKSAQQGGMGQVMTSAFVTAGVTCPTNYTDTNFLSPTCVLCVR